MFPKLTALFLAVVFILPAQAAPPPPRDPVDVTVMNTTLPVSVSDARHRVQLTMGWQDESAPAHVLDAVALVTFPAPVVVEQVSGVCSDGIVAAFLAIPGLEPLPDTGVTVAPEVANAAVVAFGYVPLPLQPTSAEHWPNAMPPVQMVLPVQRQIAIHVRKPSLYTGTDAWCHLLLVARPASP